MVSLVVLWQFIDSTWYFWRQSQGLLKCWLERCALPRVILATHQRHFALGLSHFFANESPKIRQRPDFPQYLFNPLTPAGVKFAWFYCEQKCAFFAFDSKFQRDPSEIFFSYNILHMQKSNFSRLVLIIRFFTSEYKRHFFLKISNLRKLWAPKCSVFCFYVIQLISAGTFGTVPSCSLPIPGCYSQSSEICQSAVIEHFFKFNFFFKKKFFFLVDFNFGRMQDDFDKNSRGIETRE